MILGINAIGTRGGGCETVLRSLLRGLEKSNHCRSGISKVIVFTLPKKSYGFVYSKDEFVKVVHCPWVTDNAVLRYVWMNRAFNKLVHRYKCDAVINMGGIAGALSIPQSIFLQNSLYFSTEAINTYFQKDVSLKKKIRKYIEIPLFKYFLRSSCRKAKDIVVQSNTMKQWLERDIDNAIGKVRVVRPAVPLIQQAGVSKPTIKTHVRKVFLYVGNDEPYKNLKIIFSLAEKCSTDHPDWEFCLTTTRPRNVSYNVSSNVRFLGNISKNDLFQEMKNATALLMPSLVETVGLPLIEAHAIGLPIVVADRAYARELCASAATYFDPLSVNALQKALEEIDCQDFRKHTKLNVTDEETFAEEMLNV